ncbi:MAG: sigma-70 family RNA polymerase sigma factor [Firmicutes bacterium]|nr:sigma-70 family RNA polymerase sigma factor [Bacillota bacterium]
MVFNSLDKRYMNLDDDKLVQMAQNMDRDAEQFILMKYHRFVISKVNGFFLQGGDLDDLIQEGMIGLYKGIHSYNKNENTTFRGFADICIKRQVISAIRTANRFKNQPLNNSISLNDSPKDEESRFMDDLIGTKVAFSPEDIVLGKERVNQMEKEIKDKLSSLEWTVFFEYLSGTSFEEISDELKMPIKSIYNALDRSRKKITQFLKEDELL